MSPYPYSLLPPDSDSIRLLRLLPNEDEAAPLHCELRNYSLQRPSRRTHMYEALSYVWGDPKETLPISVDEDQFHITVNLHAALLRLRDHSFERIIWVDAICIDQSNNEERKQQVQLMAKIYSNAHRVIVWLGEQGVEIEGALEDIQLAAANAIGRKWKRDTNQQAMLNLLENPWFQRIWVLQEVAAARHIVIMCGSTTIDGYAFCLGVKSLKLFSTDSPALQTLGSVVYLIERAGLRLKYTANLPGSFSLEIRSLAELIDMFHSRQATDPRDKVYALLGMSSDDPEKGMLQPDYDISWEELFQQVVKFVLGKNISMETSCQRTAIKCRGWILGKIYSVRREDRQYVTIKHNNSVRRQIGHDTEWTLQASAQPIQKFDIICLLYGALKPTIIRLCRDYFTVVVIAATPLNESSSFDWRKLSQSTTLFLRDVLLTWDWGNAYGKLQEEEEYETSTKTHSQAPVCSKADARGYLSEAARLWNVIAIFDDLGDFAKADEMILEARSNYIAAFGEDKPHVSSFRNTRTLLSSAAAEGNEDIIRLLLEQLDTVDLDIKDKEFRRSALWWAVNHGHEGVAKLLLETGKVEADSKDSFGQTPLSRAAENGHEAIVKLLLETGKVEADSKNNYGHTPLLWAAENGHEAIVKLLLDTGKVDVDLKDTVGYTPLCYAVSKGYEAVVDLLLKTGKVDIHAQTRWGRTPLSIAIDYKEHSKAIYELLLEASKAETSKVDAESKDEFGQTLFRRAIMKGQKAVANILPGWFWKDKETEG